MAAPMSCPSWPAWRAANQSRLRYLYFPATAFLIPPEDSVQSPAIRGVKRALQDHLRIIRRLVEINFGLIYQFIDMCPSSFASSVRHNRIALPFIIRRPASSTNQQVALRTRPPRFTSRLRGHRCSTNPIRLSNSHITARCAQCANRQRASASVSASSAIPTNHSARHHSILRSMCAAQTFGRRVLSVVGIDMILLLMDIS